MRPEPTGYEASVAFDSVTCHRFPTIAGNHVTGFGPPFSLASNREVKDSVMVLVCELKCKTPHIQSHGVLVANLRKKLFLSDCFFNPLIESGLKDRIRPLQDRKAGCYLFAPAP